MKNKKTFIMLSKLNMLAVISALTITGCASGKAVTVRSKTDAAGKDIFFIKKRARNTASLQIDEKTDLLTLRKALSLALMKNPELTVFSLETRAREAKILQASLLPNPEVDFEMENALSPGESETSIWLGQLIETGGKRAKREKLASLESGLAQWDYKSKKIKVFIETSRAFTSVISAQERVKLNKNLLAMSEDLADTIEKRVKAGKVSSAELSRAKVELSLMRIKLKKSLNELDSARINLSKLWGSAVPRFKEAAGKLEILASIPALARLNPLIRNYPDLGRWDIEMEHRKANLALQRAMRFPDPTIKGGYKRLNETKENEFQIGVSFPLPVFNRNQGSIKEAEIRIKQAQNKKQSVKINILSRLKKLYNSLISAHHEVLTLKNKTLPEAEKAYGLINKFYIWGKYSFLDVLYARRTIFEVKEQYLHALKEYNYYVAEIEGIIGRSLEGIR